jgi:hypothetical protein
MVILNTTTKKDKNKKKLKLCRHLSFKAAEQKLRPLVALLLPLVRSPLSSLERRLLIRTNLLSNGESGLFLAKKGNIKLFESLH